MSSSQPGPRNILVKNVVETLQSRLRAGASTDPTDALRAALDQIQSLWHALSEREETLAIERQRYAEFFEYAPDAYLITEPQGEIREANRAARELLGDPQLGGASLVAFVPELERPAFRARLVSTRGQPEGQAEEWRGSLIPASGTSPVPVIFRVRAVKVRRKNAVGLCWLVRRP